MVRVGTTTFLIWEVKLERCKKTTILRVVRLREGLLKERLGLRKMLKARSQMTRELTKLEETLSLIYLTLVILVTKVSSRLKRQTRASLWLK